MVSANTASRPVVVIELQLAARNCSTCLVASSAACHDKKYSEVLLWLTARQVCLCGVDLGAWEYAARVPLHSDVCAHSDVLISAADQRTLLMMLCCDMVCRAAELLNCVLAL